MFLDKYKKNIFKIDKNIYGFKKWNWDYKDSLSFQEEAREYIFNHRNKKIFIFTSHPRVFTLGRGLQKSKDSSFESLIDFDDQLEKKINFPLHKIKRGGGLTFHYPGQWIMYPIVNLNHPDNSLKDIIYFMLENVKKVIEKKYQINNLEFKRAFLGLWKDEYKLASVGIEIKKFITLHGLALNVKKDHEMFNELKKVNPCGLSSNIYRCMEDYYPDTISVDEFHQQFMREIFK